MELETIIIREQRQLIRVQTVAIVDYLFDRDCSKLIRDFIKISKKKEHIRQIRVKRSTLRRSRSNQ